MPSKNIAHDAKSTGQQTAHHTRTLLIIAAILFVIGLVVTLVSIQSRNISITSGSSEAVAYSNALALEYAQPYLEADRSVTTEFGDALAMQYAQSYLEEEADAAGTTTTFNDALALEYAQPYLDKQAAADTTTPYNNALAFEHALPWLVPQSTTVTYSDALAMAYARPWLNTETTESCNGRLDEMYACQNSR